MTAALRYACDVCGVSVSDHCQFVNHRVACCSETCAEKNACGGRRVRGDACFARHERAWLDDVKCRVKQRVPPREWRAVLGAKYPECFLEKLRALTNAYSAGHGGPRLDAYYARMKKFFSATDECRGS